MHAAPPCDPEEFVRTIATARIVLGAAMHLQAPPNLTDADGLADLIAAGIDDWGGVSPVTPDHVNPERPWPALDVLRAATERSGRTLAPRLTVYPEYVRAERRVAPPRRAHRGAPRVGPRRPGARRRVGERWRHRAADPPRRRPDRRRSDARGHLARTRGSRRRGARRRAGRPDRRRGRDRHAARCARSRGPRGRGGRRPAPARHRRRRRHLRPQPQHQLHEHLHVQVPVLRVLEGPAVAEPARRPVPARPRRDAAARGRGGRVRRDRGLPPGRHPPRLRRRLLPRRRPGGEGGRARHPRARLHRARGHRGREAPRHGPRASTCSSPRRPGSPRCRAPRPRSSTTRSGRSSAPTRSTPRSGCTRTAPRTRSGCVRT